MAVDPFGPDPLRVFFLAAVERVASPPADRPLGGSGGRESETRAKRAPVGVAQRSRRLAAKRRNEAVFRDGVWVTGLDESFLLQDLIGEKRITFAD